MACFPNRTELPSWVLPGRDGFMGSIYREKELAWVTTTSPLPCFISDCLGRVQGRGTLWSATFPPLRRAP